MARLDVKTTYFAPFCLFRSLSSRFRGFGHRTPSSRMCKPSVSAFNLGTAIADDDGRLTIEIEDRSCWHVTDDRCHWPGITGLGGRRDNPAVDTSEFSCRSLLLNVTLIVVRRSAGNCRPALASITRTTHDTHAPSHLAVLENRITCKTHNVANNARCVPSSHRNR